MTKICLNAGHHVLHDSGAVGCGKREADETLRIAKDVTTYLEAVGYEVLIIQDNALANVTNQSNYWGADGFVSIHLNAFNGNAKGTETHYLSANGMRLANAIQKQLVKSFPTTDRGLKQSGFYVLRNTDCPACLVEVAFIDNAEDMTLYDKHYNDIVRAIARGISDWASGSTAEPPKKNYFTEEETACKHCGKNPEGGMNKVHMQKLNQLREMCGKPLIISSGYRCPVHNANVGGVPNSEHTKGCATDILVPDGMTVYELAKMAEDIGFDGIGKYPTSGFVHVDCRDNGRNPNGYQWNGE